MTIITKKMPIYERSKLDLWVAETLSYLKKIDNDDVVIYLNERNKRLFTIESNFLETEHNIETDFFKVDYFDKWYAKGNRSHICFNNNFLEALDLHYVSKTNSYSTLIDNKVVDVIKFKRKKHFDIITMNKTFLEEYISTNKLMFCRNFDILIDVDIKENKPQIPVEHLFDNISIYINQGLLRLCCNEIIKTF